MKKKYVAILTSTFLVISSLSFGCGTKKEIKVSEDVKTETNEKEELKKPKTEVVLNSEIKELEGLVPLYWKDDENVIARNTNRGNYSFFNVNINTGKSTEVIGDRNIDKFLSVQDDGTMLITDKDSIYAVNTKDFSLKKILEDVKNIQVQSIKEVAPWSRKVYDKGYLCYVKETVNGNSIYEIINVKTEKSCEISMKATYASVDRIQISEPYIYISNGSEVSQFNLADGTQQKSMKLNKGFLLNVLKDGTVVAHGFNEDKYEREYYNLDFSNNKLTKYDEIFTKVDSNYDFCIDEIDTKNELVFFERTPKGDGVPRNLFSGRIEDGKLKIKDRLFEEGKEQGVTRKIYLYNKKGDKALITSGKFELEDGKEKYTGHTYIFELK